MSDEHELPSSGGSYTRTKSGGLRQREEPTGDGPPPPTEPQEVVVTPKTETEA